MPPLRSRSKVSRRRSRVPGPHHGPSREETLATLVAQTRRRIGTRVERSLEAHGESIHLYRILAHLIRNGIATQKGLADATSQHPAGVSRLLYTLNKRGMVKRRRDAADRRQLHVDATAAGRARFRELAPVVGTAVKDALSPLAAADRDHLIRLLRKLLAASDKVVMP